MSVSDPIADMLTRIRNALLVRHESVLMPSSRIKLAIAKLLKEEGFITDYGVVKGKPQNMLKIQLKYKDGTPVILDMEKVSRPGLKVYMKRQEIPRVYGGLGIAVVSTSKGIVTGSKAWRMGLGGEIICYVW
jgi:small subunit ribosomal protein S8